jgi:hypothetical protein
MKSTSLSALAALGIALTVLSPRAASAEPLPPGPFTTTLSNTIPLAFGMTQGDAAAALGTPLSYVSGRPDHEVLLAIRNTGGSGFFPRRNRLYLQFRKGVLTGWKGDWDRNWMWQ